MANFRIADHSSGKANQAESGLTIDIQITLDQNLAWQLYPPRRTWVQMSQVSLRSAEQTNEVPE